MVAQLLIFLSFSLLLASTFGLFTMYFTGEYTGAHRLSIVNPTIAHCRIDEHSTYFTMIHNHKSIKSHRQSAMDISMGCEVEKKGHNWILYYIYVQRNRFNIFIWNRKNEIQVSMHNDNLHVRALYIICCYFHTHTHTHDTHVTENNNNENSIIFHLTNEWIWKKTLCTLAACAYDTEQVYYYGFNTMVAIVIDSNVLSGWINFFVYIIFILSSLLPWKIPSTCSHSLILWASLLSLVC